MYDPRTQVFHRHDHHQNHTYRSRSSTNFVDKDKKQLAHNHESSYRNYVQFRPYDHIQEAMESDDSGVNSPPLWKISSSPPKSPSQPLLDRHNCWSLSPEYSRAQAITRGQWELMEMVKNMPESSYELSLKDLVEHPKMEKESQTNQEGERLANTKQILHQRGVMNVKRQQERKKNDKNIRNGGLETKGLFLNMVFPFPLSSKKKNNFASNTSGKFSPKPERIKGGGENWWKKKFTGSSDSDSSRTSTTKKGFRTGCWTFFKIRRSKTKE